MFELSGDEARLLRSQTVTLEPGRGRHPKYRPHAFTEQGVAMLSGVLRSPRAVHVNVEIMRSEVRQPFQGRVRGDTGTDGTTPEATTAHRLCALSLRSGPSGFVTNPRYIVNFPTTQHWRGHSCLEDIESGLRALVGGAR
jgi:hypothetical protein